MAALAFAQAGASLLDRAQALVQAGKFSDALPAVESYLKERPDSPDAHALRGFILFKQSKPAEALREYSETAKRRPPTAFELKIVALCYAMQEDYTNAGRWLSQAFELRPRDLQACNDLGEIKILGEKHEEAAAVFRKCLALDPKNVFAENGVGIAYEQMDRIDEAEAAYRNAVRWQAASPAQDPTPILNLGRILLKQNRPEEALEYLTRAVELGPEHAATHLQLGKAHSYVKQLESAQRELEKACRLKPDDARLHYMLGRLYREAGMTAPAEREFERFRELKNRPAPADQR
jgi:Flp pilus assembly protein TadD